MSEQKFIESYTTFEKKFIIIKYYELYCGSIWTSIKKNISDLSELILTKDNIQKICKKNKLPFIEDNIIFEKDLITVNDFIYYLEKNTDYRKGLFSLTLSETEIFLMNKVKDNKLFQQELKDYKKNLVRNLNTKNLQELKDYILKIIQSDENNKFLYNDVNLENALQENNKDVILSLFIKKLYILFYFEKINIDLENFHKSCTSDIFLRDIDPKYYQDYLEYLDRLIYKSNNAIFRNLREIMYDIIKNLIEKDIFTNETDNKEYSYYPNYFNKQFNQILYNKKEFNNCKTEKNQRFQIQKSDSFKKTNTQRFIQKFLQPQTPYNSLFLWHGVGSGKTCTGITVAENFRNVMYNLKRKILILLPNNTLEENWYNEIFNINKEIDNPSNLNIQCTGNIYSKYYHNLNKLPSIIEELQNMETSKLSLRLTKLASKYPEIDDITTTVKSGNRQQILDKLISIYKIENKKKLKNKIKKYIDSFYEISTYRKLTNDLEKEFKKFATEGEKIRYIQKNYSDRVIIMDEIHSARDVDRTKKGSIYLEMLARYGVNNKMVLLSATPIYDTVSEILFIINLLLLNDKRGILRKTDIFEDNKKKDSNELIEYMKSGALEFLEQKTRGYISYLRGQNPFTYPIKLWPDINGFLPDFFSKSSLQTYKENFESSKSLVFYENVLSDYQTEDYLLTQKKLGKKNKKLGQIINISYPNGLTFNEVFTKNNNIFTLDKSVSEDFLAIENIQQYSSKIFNIVSQILLSKGIVFVHSEFVDTGYGILPLAFVLEKAGFDRYDGSNKNVNFLIRNRNKDDCYCSINKKYYKDLSDKGTFKQAKYIYLTGTDVNKKQLNDLIEQTRSNENLDGKNILVVLASDVITQGVSFFNVRQMHIMSPWWNFSKIEQITGRGMRNLSHKNLPEAQRNITVYLHIGVIDKSKTSGDDFIEDNIITLDEYIYKVAFEKKKQTASLEYELKKNSIDCALNFYSNSFIGLSSNDITIEDSIGNIRNIKLDDKDYSFECDLQKCVNLKDKCNIQSNIDNLDTSTSFNIIEKDTIYIQEFIEKLYNKKLFYEIDEIVSKLDREKKESNKIYIYLALNDMIYQKKEFFINDKESWKKRKGYLIYRDKFYIFQPIYSDSSLVNDENIPLTYRNNWTKPINYSRKIQNKSVVTTTVNVEDTPQSKPVKNEWREFIQYTDRNFDKQEYNYGDYLPEWSQNIQITSTHYENMIYISYIERLPFDRKVSLFSNGLKIIIEKLKKNFQNPGLSQRESAFFEFFSKNKNNERRFEYSIFHNTSEERQNIKLLSQKLPIDNLPIFFRLQNKNKEFKNFMYNEEKNLFEDASFMLQLPKPTVTIENNRNFTMSGYVKVISQKKIESNGKTKEIPDQTLFYLKYNKSGIVDKKNKKKNIKYSVCGSGTDVKTKDQMVYFLNNALVGPINQDGQPKKYTELTYSSGNVIESKKLGDGKKINFDTLFVSNTLCLEIEILLRIRHYFRTDEEISSDYYYMLPSEHE